MALLGDLVVRIVGDTADFVQQIDASGRKVQKFDRDLKKISDSLIRTGKAMTTFVTLPILGIGAAFAKVAIDAEETNSKFDAVFKDQAESTREWAEEYSRSVGRSTIANIGFLATIQDTLVPLGFMRERAADMSESVVSLATDLASFNNLPTEQVIRDIQSALVGNTETLRKYGVVASQERIVQEALNSGLIQTKGELDATSKAQAIYNLIVAGTTDAQGDALRTAGSTANQLRALQASAIDLAQSFGDLLLPMINGLVQNLRSAVDWIRDLDEGQKRLILTIAGVAAAIGPTLLIVGQLINVVRQLRTVFITLNAAMLANPAFLLAAALVGLSAGLVLLVGHLTDTTREQKAYREELENTIAATKELGDEELARSRSDMIRRQAEATQEATRAQRRLIATEAELEQTRADSMNALQRRDVTAALAIQRLDTAVRETRQSYENARDRAAALGDAIKSIDDEIERRSIPLRQQQAAIEAQAAAEAEAAATERLAQLQEEARVRAQILEDAKDNVRRIIESTLTEYERLSAEIEYLRSLSFIDDAQAEADRIRAIEILDERRQLIIDERVRTEREAAKAEAEERQAQKLLKQEELAAALAEEARLKAEAVAEELESQRLLHEALKAQNDESYIDYLRLLAARKEAAEVAHNEELARQLELRRAYQAMIMEFISLANALSAREIQATTATRDARLAAIDAQIEAAKEEGSNYDDLLEERDQLNEAYDAKLSAIRRREAIRQKALGLFNVTIKTAEAIMTFLADGSVGMAIAAGITGALQAAVILAQPIPQLAEGGITPAILHPNEAVIPLDSSAALGRMVEAMERSGVSGASGSPIHLTVQMDTDTIFEKVFAASKDRRILIDARAVV